MIRWKHRMMRPGAKGSPHITLTRLGVAPVDRNGRRYPGTGYRPTSDPSIIWNWARYPAAPPWVPGSAVRAWRSLAA